MPMHKSFTAVSTCKEIVQCAFSLNDLEIETYQSMVESGPIRADELADKMKKDRSAVYRSLQKLLTCEMCFREVKSLDKGGYFYIYTALGKDELKAKLEKCIEEWNVRMRTALSRFDGQL